jgi:hypothetical protein
MKNKKKIILASFSVLAIGFGVWGSYALYEYYHTEPVGYDDLTVHVQVARSIPGYLAYSESKQAYYFYAKNEGTWLAGPVLAPADYQDSTGRVIAFNDPDFAKTLEGFSENDVLYADYRIYQSKNDALEAYRLVGEGLILPRHFYQTPKPESYYSDHFVLL